MRLDAGTFGQLVRLLASPDPSDLVGRGHRWTQAGESDRRSSRWPGIVRRWMQQRCLLLDGEVVTTHAKPARRWRHGRVLKVAGGRGQ